MIQAILCSTDNNEPWAANIGFAVHGNAWVTKLNTQFTHFKNIAENNKVVIVYKTPDFEIIAKGNADLSLPETDLPVTTIITINWLRFVKDGHITDFTDATEIDKTINAHV